MGSVGARKVARPEARRLAGCAPWQRMTSGLTATFPRPRSWRSDLWMRSHVAALLQMTSAWREPSRASQSSASLLAKIESLPSTRVGVLQSTSVSSTPERVWCMPVPTRRVRPGTSFIICSSTPSGRADVTIVVEHSAGNAEHNHLHASKGSSCCRCSSACPRSLATHDGALPMYSELASSTTSMLTSSSSTDGSMPRGHMCACSRPIVPTTSSRPPAKRSRCVAQVWSPVATVARIERCATSRASSHTCCARSLVGTTMMARTLRGGVLPLSSSISQRRCTSGATKASVFPMPLASASSRLSPFASAPKLSAWVLLGRLKPSRCKFVVSRSLVPACSHRL
mmetsp:Transcript_12253/g.31303  ORF Transcript_12253/g.31303 Transcript_12253/m.31303 type:complete len:341 (+) Transcript_12253:602-1624(+)